MLHYNLVLGTALVALAGQAAAAPEPIIGGSTVYSAGQYPYHGGLMRGGIPICGATLISAGAGKSWVITAMHCIDGVSDYTLKQQYTVRFGTVNRITRAKGHKILDVKRHSLFGGESTFETTCAAHDLVLLKLDTVTEGPNVKVAKLANAGESFVGKRCSISGWGTYRYNMFHQQQYPNTLQTLSSTVMSDSVCHQNPQTRCVDERHLCVRSAKTATTSDGDSGGGLVCRTSRGDVLAGVLSFGLMNSATRRSKKGGNNIYTSVAHFSQYIRQKTGLSGASTIPQPTVRPGRPWVPGTARPRPRPGNPCKRRSIRPNAPAFQPTDKFPRGTVCCLGGNRNGQCYIHGGQNSGTWCARRTCISKILGHW